MSRKKGSLSLTSSIEPGFAAPLDSRLVVESKDELLDAGSFPYKYIGMIVSVKNEGTAYILVSSDATKVSSWKEIGTGSGGQSVQITIDDSLSETSENPVQNKIIKSALDGKADTSVIPDVSSFVTKEDLPDTSSFVTKDDLPDTSSFATKNDIPDVSGFATKSDIPDVSVFASKSDLSAKQDALTFDTAPTENSGNPVTSGGVYTALHTEIGSYDYLFSWDSSTKELILNEGETDEQRLRLSGLSSAQDITTKLDKKVDKVDGKGLSPEEYTSAEKSLLASLAVIKSIGIGLTLDANGELKALNNVDLSGYYTKSEIDNIISNLGSLDLVPVSSLPTADIRTDCIYLLNDSSESNNIYSEYVYINGSWEKFGTATVDLSNYYTKLEVDSAITTSGNNKVDKIQGKGLSTEDYTTAEKTKLGDLSSIKSIGTGLALDASTGELTATGAITASAVEWANVLNKPEVFYDDSALSGTVSQIQTNLGNYYQKTETYNRTEIDNKISNVTVDLTGYVTTSALTTELSNYTASDDLATLLSDKANSVDIPEAASDQDIDNIIVEVYGATNN